VLDKLLFPSTIRLASLLFNHALGSTSSGTKRSRERATNLVPHDSTGIFWISNVFSFEVEVSPTSTFQNLKQFVLCDVVPRGFTTAC
jgi:hypothetical protein